MIEEKIAQIIKNFSEKDVKKEIKVNGIKIRRRKSEKRFVKELRNFEREGGIFVSDKGFAGNYLQDCGISKIFFLEREDLKNVKECKLFAHRKKAKFIIGFGGGRALDIAKKTAFDTEKKLILIPTAPSHNGLISQIASLYKNRVKKSFVCKFPSKVIIPLFLWRKATRHIKAGMLDVLGSVTAVQDAFLSHVKTGEKLKNKELKLSLFGVKKAINMKGLKDLELALLCGGIAMKGSSRYCSGSEHEAEKALAESFKEYMHGEIVGICSLIVAKIYSERIKETLLFDSSKLFDDLVKIYKKCALTGVINDILYNENFLKKAPTLLKNVDKIRPERFTLWNVVTPKKLNFNEILLEIRESL